MTTKPDTEHLVLFIKDHQVVCYAFDSASQWTLKRIKGETLTPLKPDRFGQLELLLSELSDQINQPKALSGVQVDLFCDVASLDLLLDVPARLAKLQCSTWQILRWDRLYLRAATHQLPPVEHPMGDMENAQYPGTSWIRNVLLPTTAKMLWGDDSTPTDSAVAEDEDENKDPDAFNTEAYARQAKRLRALERRNAELEARLSDAQPPLDGEQLLTFLPALYLQVFTVLSGADLAALIGRVEPFHIPSPYQELTPDALHKKQREFLALPLAQQQAILGFAQSASQRLHLRPEMLPHVHRIQEA